MNPFFKDLKVVELANVLAGPAVGLFFAELGAQVTKIENSSNGGDVTRSWKTNAEDPTSSSSAYFASVNWHKAHRWLDLRTASDREQAYQLIREADVLISNYKKDDDKKLGMEPARLFQLNPRLIIGRINGFGVDSNRIAYDLVLQAETGFMSMNGTEASGPLKMPVALIDVLAAHHLKEGLLVALLQRSQTGKGALVDVSLQDAAIASLANQASNFLMTGVNPGLSGSLHPNIAPYGETFATADGKSVVLAVGNNKQFAQLSRILNLSVLSQDPRFQENSERVKNRQELAQLLKPAILKKTATTFLQECIELDVPAGQIRQLAELFNERNSALVLVDTDERGKLLKRVRTVAFAIK